MHIGGTPVLRDLSMHLEAGEVAGLHGPNGSGKTTLLRLVATLIPPSGGTGRVLGADLVPASRFDVRTRIGFVGHQPSLYPELTLEENTAFVAGIVGAPAERVLETLDIVGLAGATGRRASACSHGMQRRAEFARILLTEPDLVLLDEAHAGLDPQAADLVTMIAKNAQSRGGGAVLVSHDPTRLESVVDRMYQLDGGKLWSQGGDE